MSLDERCIAVRLSSMRCAVILLRRDGVRLRSNEVSPSVSGDLDLTDHQGSSTFLRSMRVANLWGETASEIGRPLLSENGNPTIDTVHKVLHAVGLRLSVTPA